VDNASGNANDNLNGENAAAPADGAASDSPNSPNSKDPRDAKIQELEAQLKEKNDRYLYLYAEFDNFKKRAVKERSDLMKYGWENVAREMILVMDNFQRALSHIPAGTDKNLADGLQMILSQFRSSLQKQGVQQIEALGKEFNPELEEAVGQMPSDQPAGTVVREELPGYTLHGRLLRPANVIVSMGQAAAG
jgi:molecular chaperone GrpE